MHRKDVAEKAMTARTIGHRLFTDGVPRPVYQDECGQFIPKDGEPSRVRSALPELPAGGARPLCRVPRDRTEVGLIAARFGVDPERLGAVWQVG